MPRYWCHTCDRIVNVSTDGTTCSLCNGEFIEIMPDSSPLDQPFQATSGAPVNLFSTLFQGIFNNPQHQPPQQPFVFNAAMPQFQPNQNAQQPNQANNDAQQMQNILQALFNPAPMNNAPQQQNPQNQQQPNQQNPPNPFQFIQNLMVQLNGQPIRIQLGDANNLFRNVFPGMGGMNFGDYVPDAAMSNILDQLFRQYQGNQRPAAKDILKTLPKVIFTEKTVDGECSICRCAWTVGEEAVELPCHHHFHADCISPWFEKSNVCPMCRYEVQTDDPAYEETRKQKIKEREDQLRQSRGNDPNSSSDSSNPSTPNEAASSRITEDEQTNDSKEKPSSSPHSASTDEQSDLLDDALDDILSDQE